MKYEYWFASQTKISSKKRIQARKLCPDAKTLYIKPKETLEKMHIFSEEEIQWLCKSKENWNVDEQWRLFQKSGANFVLYSDASYPERLRHIYDAPYALFYKGTLPDLTSSVGIVGARMCSEYGRSIAEKLGKRLAQQNVSVISGMAMGIDSAAHAGALSEAGKTYAVLGCGCDICYPKSSWNIYQNILKSKGGILSEYLPGTRPMPYRFPERNRIISALSDIVVVVEAREKSGSLITVDCALEQGKDIYAVPGRYGDVLSAGCNRLIYQGAGILYNIEIFLEEIGILCKNKMDSAQSDNLSLEKEERLVYSCLDLHPKFINNIIEETDLNLLTVLHTLEKLKKRRLIQETFQNYYCRYL